MPGITVGSLGPYADKNWSTVCQEATEWFAREYDLPLDRQDNRLQYNDEVGVPSELATIYLCSVFPVVVAQQDRKWALYAFAKRVPGSGYYYTPRIRLHDATLNEAEAYLCVWDLEFDESSTRSRVMRVDGEVPARQIPII